MLLLQRRIIIFTSLNGHSLLSAIYCKPRDFFTKLIYYKVYYCAWSGLCYISWGKRISQLEGANHFESSPWDRGFLQHFTRSEASVTEYQKSNLEFEEMIIPEVS